MGLYEFQYDLVDGGIICPITDQVEARSPHEEVHVLVEPGKRLVIGVDDGGGEMLHAGHVFCIFLVGDLSGGVRRLNKAEEKKEYARRMALSGRKAQFAPGGLEYHDIRCLRQHPLRFQRGAHHMHTKLLRFPRGDDGAFGAARFSRAYEHHFIRFIHPCHVEPLVHVQQPGGGIGRVYLEKLYRGIFERYARASGRAAACEIHALDIICFEKLNKVASVFFALGENGGKDLGLLGDLFQHGGGIFCFHTLLLLWGNLALYAGHGDAGNDLLLENEVDDERRQHGDQHGSDLDPRIDIEVGSDEIGDGGAYGRDVCS